eukprot:scaffold55316_cov45-Phaeocystis_antarctica.AAC.1
MPPGYRHMAPVPYATWVPSYDTRGICHLGPSYDTRVICHVGVAYDGPPYTVMGVRVAAVIRRRLRTKHRIRVRPTPCLMSRIARERMYV